jgi:hypothetical protein
MFKKAVQRGRSEQRDEACPQTYGEDGSDARIKLAAFFKILLSAFPMQVIGQSQQRE